MFKVLERSRIQGTYLNIMKAIGHNPIYSQHQIKWRETQSNFTKVRDKTRLSSPYVHKMGCEALVRVIRPLKEVKGIEFFKKGN